MFHPTFKAASRANKVSDQIISQIRDEILSGRLKPGDKVASEKELIAQFEVSKATVREALRALEVMGLVETRKGVAGGVFVAEVDMKTTIHSIINFLHFKSVSIRDITMIRYLLEPPIAEMAVFRADDRDLDQLEAMIDESPANMEAAISGEIGFHRYLARLTENPILILITDFIDNMLRDIKFHAKLEPGFYREVTKAHQSIVRRLRDRDASGAREAITRDILWVCDYLAERTNSSTFDPVAITGGEIHRMGGYPLQRAGKTFDDRTDLTRLQKRLTEEGIQVLKKSGALLQSVGTGEIYLVAFSEGHPRKRRSRLR
ncbi:MAG: FCD domain-containing protein [Thermodesulfobacteriota bacterium]